MHIFQIVFLTNVLSILIGKMWSGPPPCLNKNTLKNRIQFREKTVRTMTSYNFCNLIKITKLTVAAKWKRSDSSAALACGVVLVVDVVLVGHVKFFRGRLRRGLISELSGEVLSKFSLPECQLSTAAALGSLRLWRPPPPLPSPALFLNLVRKLVISRRRKEFT